MGEYLSDEVAAHLWYGSSRFMEMANFIARGGHGQSLSGDGYYFSI